MSGTSFTVEEATIGGIHAAMLAGELRCSALVEAYLSAHRRLRPGWAGAEHDRDPVRSGAAAGRANSTRNWPRPGGCPARCTAYRCWSRTASRPLIRRPRSARSRLPAIWRGRTPRWSGGCAQREPWCWGRRRCVTSPRDGSRTPRSPATRRTPTNPGAIRAGRAPDRPRRSRRISPPSRWAPIAAARCGCRPRSAMSSVSGPRRRWSRMRERWCWSRGRTRSARWRGRSRMRPRCCR